MGGKGSGAKPKTYPSDLVTAVRTLYYDGGHTQQEIAGFLGVTQHVIWRVMIRHGLETRPRVKRNQFGAANHMWKGDDAGYQAMHIRLDKRFGKPCECRKCGTTNPSLRYEWANLTGVYADVDDYARMCVYCHRKFDADRRQITGERTSPVRR